jgi:hypothetical protein
MANPYPIGPGKAAIAHFKAGGGAIGWAPGTTWLWSVDCRVRIVAGAPYIGAVALAAATSQEISLNAAFPASAFPANMQVGEAYIKRITDFAGGSISALTVQVGDTGDPNGLLTATSVFTGVGAGYTATVAAAEYAMHPEAAFVPTLTLTATADDLDTITAGRLKVVIPIRPLHE